MVLPTLVNPIKVTIRQLDKTSTSYSNSSRYKKGKTIYSSPVTIDCVPFFGRQDDPRLMEGGIDEEVSGYIVVRFIDMNSLSLPRFFDRGDKIVSFGEGTNVQNVEYFLTKTKLAAAYPDQSGFTLRKYFFASRLIETPGGDV